MTDTFQRQFVDVHLWTADDRATYADLAQNLQAAAEVSDAGPISVGGGSPTSEAASALKEFAAEADERARVVRMLALKRSEWRSMKDRHPIRMIAEKVTDAEGNESTTEVPNEVDERYGFNADSIADELVPASIDASNFATIAARDEFIDSLSEPDFDELYRGALQVNVVGFSAPKADISLRLDRIIAETSTSLDLSD